MTWEWSHSEEGIQNVRKNISLLTGEELKIIFAEILTYKYSIEKENLERMSEGEEPYNFFMCPDNYFDQEFYDFIIDSKYLQELVSSHNNCFEEYSQLSELVFGYASKDLKECDNGGFNAYLTPYHSFSVPFSSKEES